MPPKRNKKHINKILDVQTSPSSRIVTSSIDNNNNNNNNNINNNPSTSGSTTTTIPTNLSNEILLEQYKVLYEENQALRNRINFLETHMMPK